MRNIALHILYAIEVVPITQCYKVILTLTYISLNISDVPNKQSDYPFQRKTFLISYYMRIILSNYFLKICDNRKSKFIHCFRDTRYNNSIFIKTVGTVVDGAIAMNGRAVGDFMHLETGYMHQDELFVENLTVMEHLTIMVSVRFGVFFASLQIKKEAGKKLFKFNRILFTQVSPCLQMLTEIHVFCFYNKNLQYLLAYSIIYYYLYYILILLLFGFYTLA